MCTRKINVLPPSFPPSLPPQTWLLKMESFEEKDTLVMLQKFVKDAEDLRLVVRKNNCGGASEASVATLTDYVAGARDLSYVCQKSPQANCSTRMRNGC